MTKRTILTLVLGCVISGGVLDSAQAARGRRRSTTPTTSLTAAEITDLRFMREEEKLAHDVYSNYYKLWNNRIFNNISNSEQRHTDAILNLLVKYKQPDPALQQAGVFSDAVLQKLYNELIARGKVSALEALYAGALIEEVDIADIELAKKNTQKSDILNVYNNLLSGSKSHLKSFVINIERMTGKKYQAQYLTQDEVDALLGR